MFWGVRRILFSGQKFQITLASIRQGLFDWPFMTFYGMFCISSTATVTSLSYCFLFCNAGWVVAVLWVCRSWSDVSTTDTVSMFVVHSRFTLPHFSMLSGYSDLWTSFPPSLYLPPLSTVTPAVSLATKQVLPGVAGLSPLTFCPAVQCHPKET